MAIEVNTILSAVINWGAVLVILIILLVVGGVGYYLWTQAKKFSEFICVIFSRDAFGNVIREVDNAGIFVDKSTSMKRFFLKKHRVGLDPDQVKYMLSPYGNKKVVYLRKYSLKNFAYIDMAKLLENDNPTLKVTEQDTNWAIQEYRKHKALDNQNFLEKYGAQIAFGFTLICALVLVALLFQKFEVFTNVAASINQAAQALKEAAQQLAAAKSGTTIIQ